MEEHRAQRAASAYEVPAVRPLARVVSTGARFREERSKAGLASDRARISPVD
jgi:hypothetical protein